MEASMFQILSALRLGANATRFLGTLFSRVGTAASSGFDELSSALGNLETEFQNETAKAQEQSIANMKSDLMAYPAARTGSTYTRTYILRNGWQEAPVVTTNSIVSGFPAKVTSIENPVPYAGWVQRRSTQTYWNRARWTTVEDAIAANTPSVVDTIIRALNVLARSF